MSIKATLTTCCMAAAVLTLTASGGWAAVSCTTKTVGTGIYTTKIAVASNFTTPAADLVDAFQATTAGANTAITICNDSTANLETAINADATLYSMLFAADATAANYNSSTRTAYSYAKGIPVFFKYSTAGDGRKAGSLLSGLLPAQKNSAAVTLTGSSLSAYNIADTTTASHVAIANSGAPYGVAAFAIVNTMTSGKSDATNLPTTIPAWVVSPLYSNINYTFSAVTANGTVNSGFVSKAQICSILNSVAYVAFTNAAYTLDQKAILLLPSDTVAADLNSYIQGKISDGTWNSTFLPNHCYGTI